MNGQTDEQKSPCVLQDFVPFGAAALLPLQFTIMQSRATGIADHILPFGDLFVNFSEGKQGSGPKGDKVL